MSDHIDEIIARALGLDLSNHKQFPDVRCFDLLNLRAVAEAAHKQGRHDFANDHVDAICDLPKIAKENARREFARESLKVWSENGGDAAFDWLREQAKGE